MEKRCGVYIARRLRLSDTGIISPSLGAEKSVRTFTYQLNSLFDMSMGQKLCEDFSKAGWMLLLPNMVVAWLKEYLSSKLYSNCSLIHWRNQLHRMHQILTLWNRAQFGDPWLIRDVTIPGAENLYSNPAAFIGEGPIYGSSYDDYW